MKRIVATILALILCVSSTYALAEDTASSVVPINSAVSEQNSIVDCEENQEELSPRILLGYRYVPGHEQLTNFQIVRLYAYIYGTSISFTSGVSPSYTVTVRHQTTETTTWNLSVEGSAEFDIRAVKAALAAEGGYSESETASLEVGVEWDLDFTGPGMYDLTWYMRGHQYDAYCGATYISTDGNDGKYLDKYVGTVVFPTTEVTFESKLVEAYN